jgi:hypothetical protein
MYPPDLQPLPRFSALPKILLFPDLHPICALRVVH